MGHSPAKYYLAVSFDKRLHNGGTELKFIRQIVVDEMG
jgi:hypothetical protein